MAAQDNFMRAVAVKQGLASEGGRLMRANQIDLSSVGDQAESLTRTMARFGGTKNIKLFNQLSDGLIDTEDASVGAERLALFNKKLSAPTFGDKLQEAYYGSILSSPASLLKNIGGNASVAALSIPETAAATGINAVRRLFGAETNTMYAGEAAARAVGMWKGLTGGINDVLTAGWGDAKDFMSGAEVGGLRQHAPAIGGYSPEALANAGAVKGAAMQAEKAVGTATRFLPQLHGASDAFFRGVTSSGEL